MNAFDVVKRDSVAPIDPVSRCSSSIIECVLGLGPDRAREGKRCLVIAPCRMAEIDG
jgi:hypothetical protein